MNSIFNTNSVSDVPKQFGQGHYFTKNGQINSNPNAINSISCTDDKGRQYTSRRQMKLALKAEKRASLGIPTPEKQPVSQAKQINVNGVDFKSHNEFKQYRKHNNTFVYTPDEHRPVNVQPPAKSTNQSMKGENFSACNKMLAASNKFKYLVDSSDTEEESESIQEETTSNVPSTVVNSKYLSFTESEPIKEYYTIANYHEVKNTQVKNKKWDEQPNCSIDSNHVFNYVQLLFKHRDFAKYSMLLNCLVGLRRSIMQTLYYHTTIIDKELLETINSVEITSNLPDFMVSTFQLPVPILREKFKSYEGERWYLISRVLTTHGEQIPYTQDIMRLFIYIREVIAMNANNFHNKQLYEKFPDEWKQAQADFKAGRTTFHSFTEMNYAFIKEHSNYANFELKGKEESIYAVNYEVMKKYTESNDVSDVSKFRTRLLWKINTYDVTQCGLEEIIVPYIKDTRILMVQHFKEFEYNDYETIIENLIRDFYIKYPDFSPTHYSIEQFKEWIIRFTYIRTLEILQNFNKLNKDNESIPPESIITVDDMIFNHLYTVFLNCEYYPYHYEELTIALNVEEEKLNSLLEQKASEGIIAAQKERIKDATKSIMNRKLIIDNYRRLLQFNTKENILKLQVLNVMTKSNINLMLQKLKLFKRIFNEHDLFFTSFKELCKNSLKQMVTEIVDVMKYIGGDNCVNYVNELFNEYDFKEHSTKVVLGANEDKMVSTWKILSILYLHGLSSIEKTKDFVNMIFGKIESISSDNKFIIHNKILFMKDLAALIILTKRGMNEDERNEIIQTIDGLNGGIKPEMRLVCDKALINDAIAYLNGKLTPK